MFILQSIKVTTDVLGNSSVYDPYQWIIDYEIIAHKSNNVIQKRSKKYFKPKQNRVYSIYSSNLQTVVKDQSNSNEVINKNERTKRKA